MVKASLRDCCLADGLSGVSFANPQILVLCNSDCPSVDHKRCGRRIERRRSAWISSYSILYGLRIGVVRIFQVQYGTSLLLASILYLLSFSGSNALWQEAVFLRERPAVDSAPDGDRAFLLITSREVRGYQDAPWLDLLLDTTQLLKDGKSRMETASYRYLRCRYLWPGGSHSSATSRYIGGRKHRIFSLLNSITCRTQG